MWTSAAPGSTDAISTSAASTQRVVTAVSVPRATRPGGSASHVSVGRYSLNGSVLLSASLLSFFTDSQEVTLLLSYMGCSDL